MANKPNPNTGVPISKQSILKVKGGKPVTPQFHDRPIQAPNQGEKHQEDPLACGERMHEFDLSAS